MSKEKWTFGNNGFEAEDDLMTVTFSPDIEQQVNSLMIDIIGVRFLRCDKTIHGDGSTTVSVPLSIEEREIFKGTMINHYLSKHGLFAISI